jgi:5-hmdU DNA kinase, helical domain
MNPVPRKELYDAYWRFAAERQFVFFRRLRDEQPPWSDDPILQTYKFCNAYRASDRVSQFLIRNVIYQSETSPEDVLLRIVLFRLFSKMDTWQLLEATHGQISVSTFSPDVYSDTLEQALTRGEAVYTNAFILCANNTYGFSRKHRNHLALVEAMLRSHLPRKITMTKSLEEIYQLLIDYPLVGPFMAYQLAIDINYSELTDFDENDFTMPGPGAIRGINKCFRDTGFRSMSNIVHWMVDRQEHEFERLGLNFQSLFGRPLHAIDCQNLFCEIDKYARVAFPDLKSNRIRIKAKFKPTPSAIDYFYPPKWGINEAAAAAQTAAILDRTESGGRVC